MFFYRKRKYVFKLLVLSMFQLLVSMLFIYYTKPHYIGIGFIYFSISSVVCALVVIKSMTIRMQSELKIFEQYLISQMQLLESNMKPKDSYETFDHEFIDKLQRIYDELNDILSDVYEQQSKVYSNSIHRIQDRDYAYERDKIIQRIHAYSLHHDDQVFNFNLIYESKRQRGDI